MFLHILTIVYFLLEQVHSQFVELEGLQKLLYLFPNCRFHLICSKKFDLSFNVEFNQPTRILSCKNAFKREESVLLHHPETLRTCEHSLAQQITGLDWFMDASLKGAKSGTCDAFFVLDLAPDISIYNARENAFFVKIMLESFPLTQSDIIKSPASRPYDSFVAVMFVLKRNDKFWKTESREVYELSIVYLGCLYCTFRITNRQKKPHFFQIASIDEICMQVKYIN